MLVAEAERDDVVPHRAIANDVVAFERAHSPTRRVVGGAEHGLSEERRQQAYTSLPVNRATGMVLGAREGGAAPGAHTRLRPSPRGGPPRSA